MGAPRRDPGTVRPVPGVRGRGLVCLDGGGPRGRRQETQWREGHREPASRPVWPEPCAEGTPHPALAATPPAGQQARRQSAHPRDGTAHGDFSKVI